LPGDIAKKHLFLTFEANFAFPVSYFTLFHLPPINLNCGGGCCMGLNLELAPEWGLERKHLATGQIKRPFVKETHVGVSFIRLRDLS
jgi:hypothetical protein